LSGINYCIKYSYSKSLTKLYQTRALALKTLGKTSEVDKYIAKSLANSISIETTKQTITLSEQLVKQFNINPEKVLKEYFE
jgi:hypothetical protein